MERCDVAIVGGGPAGSSCAWKLRQAGLDVVVLDKARFPRDKVCAGWITPPVIHSLRLDLEDYVHGSPCSLPGSASEDVPAPGGVAACEARQEQRVCQPFTAFVTGLIHGPEVCTEYTQPVSYGIRRCEFDTYLLFRSGARLCLGEPLHNLQAEPDGWCLNQRLRASLLIGAGGTFCPVARLLAQVDPQCDDPVVLAQEVEFPLPPERRDDYPVAGHRPELYFCPDLAGYGWIVRKGDYLNIGLGREQERNLSSHLADFLEFLKQRGKLTVAIPQPFRGHAYKLRRYVPPVHVPDRVLLIGDAAGLAYPQSGEGIRPAVESGLIAAETILEARGHYAGSFWQRYRERCRQRFGAGSPRGVDWPLPWKQWAARKLLASRWFTRHVLLDRWFLHAHQAAL